MHGLMSGDGKRGYKLPRPSSTLRVKRFLIDPLSSQRYLHQQVVTITISLMRTFDSLEFIGFLILAVR